MFGVREEVNNCPLLILVTARPRPLNQCVYFYGMLNVLWPQGRFGVHVYKNGFKEGVCFVCLLSGNGFN